MLEIKNDKIVKFVFAQVNGSNLLYTGTQQGIIY